MRVSKVFPVNLRIDRIDMYRWVTEMTTEDYESFTPGGWTSDHRTLVWVQGDVPPRTNIRMMGPDGKPTVLLDPGATLEAPSVSRDGRWLAYTSNQSGRREVYVAPLPRGAPAQRISTEGGAQPRWRRDGRELYYVSATGELMAVPMRTTGDIAEGATPQILFPARLQDTAGVLHATQYDVAPDVTRFLVNRIHRQPAEPLTVVLDWTTALKQ